MKPVKAVLFDLDGTLLPMDNDAFVRVYFGDLARCFPDIDPGSISAAIMASVAEMARVPGGETNDEKFKRAFARRIARDWAEMEPVFTRFYEERFPELGRYFPAHPDARRAYDAARSRGFRVSLATNPIFPRSATFARIGWAGFAPDEFEIITSYEDTRSCKPHAAYFDEVLCRMGGLEPADCLMVGNDVREDILPARAAGMRAFFLSDYPIPAEMRTHEVDCDARGSWDELIAYIASLEGFAA